MHFKTVSCLIRTQGGREPFRGLWNGRGAIRSRASLPEQSHDVLLVKHRVAFNPHAHPLPETRFRTAVKRPTDASVRERRLLETFDNDDRHLDGREWRQLLVDAIAGGNGPATPGSAGPGQ